MYNIKDIYNVSNIYIRSDYITCKLLLALDYIRPVSVSSSFSYTFFHPLSSIFFGCTFFLCYFELFSFSYSRSAESVEINKHTNFLWYFFCLLCLSFHFYFIYFIFFIQFVLFSVSYFVVFCFYFAFLRLFYFILFFYEWKNLHTRREPERKKEKKDEGDQTKTPHSQYLLHTTFNTIYIYIYNIYNGRKRERKMTLLFYFLFTCFIFPIFLLVFRFIRLLPFDFHILNNFWI